MQDYTFILYEKMSKKQKKEFDRMKRNTWEFSPVTRVKQSKKAYNRKRLESQGSYYI